MIADSEFQRKYLTEYFDSMSEPSKTKLLVEFFQELQIQELVGGCPIDNEEVIQNPDLTLYWAHTGEPLI
jgi:hypothetical protein